MPALFRDERETATAESAVDRLSRPAPYHRRVIARLPQVRYDEYLAAGDPIATGVIEGACRHLVKDRLKRSGMRWTLEGAQAMLHLRALRQSSYWDKFHSRPASTTASPKSLTGYRGIPVVPVGVNHRD